LKYPTTDLGGQDTEHKGVFQDDVGMLSANDLTLVGQNSNAAYIIGSGGAVIVGYSDDATLAGEGFLPSEYQAARLRKTANHVVVSLLGGLPADIPTNHAYAISYIIRGDSGSHDITVSAMEIIELGEFTITWKDFV
jgi:hypothetical protein